MSPMIRYSLVLLLSIFTAIGPLSEAQAFENSGKQISSQEVKYYSVQIAASRTFVNPDDFKRKFNLRENVEFSTKDGWYKYYFGKYRSSEEAKIKLNQLGIDGFIIRTPIGKTDTLAVQGSTRTIDVGQPRQGTSVKYYTNSKGVRVQSPTHYDAAPAGATAKCRDGTYSFSQNHRGTCSHHGGVEKWLK